MVNMMALSAFAEENTGGKYVSDVYIAYEDLLKDKKAEINEFINSFLPVLKEYRANYNGEGSAVGQKRAQLTYEMLNKFYDGGIIYPGSAGNQRRGRSSDRRAGGLVYSFAEAQKGRRAGSSLTRKRV